MAKCDCCGKGVAFGIKVSHSHRRANRAWKPNVKRVKAVVDGSPRYIYACTRCLRSGKVTRALYGCKSDKAPQNCGAFSFSVLRTKKRRRFSPPFFVSDLVQIHISHREYV